MPCYTNLAKVRHTKIDADFSLTGFRSLRVRKLEDMLTSRPSSECFLVHALLRLNSNMISAQTLLQTPNERS